MVLLAIHALPAVGTPQEATLISIYQKNNLKGITRKVGALFLAFIQHISLFLQGDLTVHIWNVVFVLLLRFAILNWDLFNWEPLNPEWPWEIFERVTLRVSERLLWRELCPERPWENQRELPSKTLRDLESCPERPWETQRELPWETLRRDLERPRKRERESFTLRDFERFRERESYSERALLAAFELKISTPTEAWFRWGWILGRFWAYVGPFGGYVGLLLGPFRSMLGSVGGFRA